MLKIIIYLGYKFLEFLAFVTPYPVSYLIAFFVSKIVYMCNIYVDILKTNVSNVTCLDKSSREVAKIVKKIYYHWFRNVVDFLKHPIISTEKLKQRVEIAGLENLDNALKKGKGIVIFTAHIGNFEWGACRVAGAGYKIWGTALSRPYYKTNLFFENRRLSKGLKTIYVDKTILNIFRILKDNKIIAIPADFDPLGTANQYDFFGRKAYMPSGPVEIAMRTGAAFIPSFIWRKDKYNHFQIVGEPLELNTEGEKKDLIRSNMQKMLEVMEKFIAEHIEEWELFHNIWAS
ncbi:MAG: hypothetical protein FJW61_04595 [Actinobacteria bacterium]|nr:hypothetical protein [Actinomycetota bacterium]